MIVTDGLILYLHGACGKNNPATRVWKDLSGNGNDGELMNFNFTEDSGWGDGGLRFDGVDDWLKLGRQYEVLDGASFTISFVLKIIEPHSDSVGVMLFGNEGLKLRIYSYRPYLQLLAWGNSFSEAELQQGTTHYVDFSYSDRRAKIYIDGTLSLDQTKDIEWDYQYYRHQSFNINEYANRYSDIIIYKISIYNRALTDEEILQNYRAGHEWTPQIGKREATTTMKPITADLTRKGKGKREVISTVKPITSSLERKGKGKREVITTMKPITSELTRKGIGKREVTTTMKPITSNITKKLPPIHANIGIQERTPNIATRERIPRLEVD